MAGTWIADLASSKLHKGSPIRTATLEVAVTSETVTITDSIQNAAGQQIGTGTTTFRTDGKPYPHDALMPGLMVAATWSSTNVLETTLKQKNGQTDRVTYEVSSDGKMLTTKTSGPLGDQVIVFRRQP